MILVIPQNELANSKPVDSGVFGQVGVKERQHIQEWIRYNPTILGENLKVISIEFDQFDIVSDRSDIIALDQEGNLVIVELKRDSFGGYADLQAIRYAALLSTATVADIVSMYVKYCQKYLNKPEQTQELAMRELENFISDGSFDKISGNPRIILCAENFSAAITTTALWLNTVGLDVSCVRLQPHVVNDQIIIVATKIIPTPEASDYMVRVQKKELQEDAEAEKNQRRRRTMKILLEKGILKPGDKIYLKAGSPYVKYQENDNKFIATIIGGESQAIRWDHDGKKYAISALTRQIFNSFNSNFTRTPNGNAYWTNREGVALWQLAESYLGAEN